MFFKCVNDFKKFVSKNKDITINFDTELETDYFLRYQAVNKDGKQFTIFVDLF